MVLEMAGTRERGVGGRGGGQRTESRPASLVRFMPAFYAPLNYLVNGTMGARHFCPRAYGFSARYGLLTALYPTGLLPNNPTIPVNGVAPGKEREKGEIDRTVRHRTKERLQGSNSRLPLRQK